MKRSRVFQTFGQKCKVTCIFQSKNVTFYYVVVIVCARTQHSVDFSFCFLFENYLICIKKNVFIFVDVLTMELMLRLIFQFLVLLMRFM